MVLIGRALRELPLVILAWRRALARGIGKLAIVTSAEHRHYASANLKSSKQHESH
jgi:hypothetical protein